MHELVDDVTLEGQMVQAAKVEDYLISLDKGFLEPENSKHSYPEVINTRQNRTKYLEEKRDKLIKKEKQRKEDIYMHNLPKQLGIDENLNGGMCSKGANYVKQEILNPKRVLQVR